MPVSERYQQTLANWVTQEADRCGGLPALALKMSIAVEEPVSRETLRKWQRQQVGKEGIRGKSLKALAAYRKQPPEEVIAWLEGRTHDQKFLDLQTAISFVATAPLSDVCKLAEAALRRLQAETLSTSEPMCHPLRFLVCREFERQGLNPLSPDDRELFMAVAGGAFDLNNNRARLTLLLEEGQNTFRDLALLAATLRLFSGTDDSNRNAWYTPDNLADYIRNPPKEAIESCLDRVTH